MPENFWETEVYGVEPISELERIDAGEVFSWVESTMPSAGSRVDWSSVSGAHAHRHLPDAGELARATSQEIVRRTDGGSRVEHVGDGLSPVGVRFGRGDVAAIVKALLEVPEHHYFLDADRSWLVVVSFEGHLDVVDFGTARNGGVRSGDRVRGTSGA